jgi:hypothetical protein
MTLNGLAMIFIWIAILIFLSRVVDHLLRRSLGPTLYMIIVTPGVAVHELSHTLGCFLTGARVVEVKLISKQGGYVKHTKPRIPVVGPVVISLFPLFGGVLFIWIIAMAMNYSGIGLLDLNDPISSAGRLASFFSANFLRWHFWIFLYLLVSVSASLGPSNRDIRNCALGLTALALLFAVMIMASPFLASSLDHIGRPLMAGMNLALFLLVFSLIIVLPVYVIKR